mgnify:CR=1 FL=1
MIEELRKVQFNLNEQNLTYGDLGFNDSEGIMEERHGYFHCWGNVTFYDAEEERYKQKTVAIIEDTVTGKVFEIAPRCVSFETSTNNN